MTRPFLTIDELEKRRDFGPSRVRLAEDELAAFRRITNTSPDSEASNCIPQGMCGVFLRWSYLQEYEMPPGGIITGLDFHFRETLPVDEDLHIAAKIDKIDRSHTRYPRVQIASSVSDANSRILQAATLRARWPMKEQKDA